MSKKLSLSLLFYYQLVVGGIFAFNLPQTSFASSILLAPRLAMGLDTFGHHIYHLNPALYQADGLQVLLTTYRIKSESELVSEQNNNAFVQKSQTSENYLAFATMGDAGSGLGFGFSIEQLNGATKSNRDVIFWQDLNESFDSRYITAKAVVELTESLSCGFNLRFLDVEYSIIGNFLVNAQQDVTVFKTSSFGSGAGVKYTNNKFVLAAGYLPPMKGKSEVIGEEKIISEPGMTDLGAGAILKGNFKVGAVYRRYLYKEDDRSLGTTLNDQNNSQINLNGVDIEKTNIKPLTELQLAVGWPLSGATQLNLGFSRETLTYVLNPQESLPGEDEQDPKQDRNRWIADFIIKRAKLSFLIGVRIVNATMDFSSSNVTRQFTSKKQNLWLGVGTVM